jgi:hypothetical protein
MLSEPAELPGAGKRLTVVFNRPAYIMPVLFRSRIGINLAVASGKKGAFHDRVEYPAEWDEFWAAFFRGRRTCIKSLGPPNFLLQTGLNCE